MKRFLSCLFILVLLFNITACGSGEESAGNLSQPSTATQPDSGESVKTVTVPFGCEDYPTGAKYWDVEQYFRDCGFTNIESVGSENLSAKLYPLDNTIAMIKINGAKFSEGDAFDADAEVVITYFSFSDAGLVELWGAPAVAKENGLDDYLNALVTPKSIVYFGSYEQDDNVENGEEPIKWIVLDTDGSKSLLLSYLLLDGHAYNTDENAGEAVTWETCSLRAWLNEDFINQAFTEEEQKHILLTTLDNSYTTSVVSENDVIPGKPTEDKVFVLDAQETKQYIGDDLKAMVKVIKTPYAAKKDILDAWWVRTSVTKLNVSLVAEVPLVKHAAYFDSRFSHSDNMAIRPAIWIDVNSFSD